MRLGLLAFSCAVASVDCSSIATTSPPDPKDFGAVGAGLIVYEQVVDETGELETWAPTTHAYMQRTGTSYDSDAELRRVVDPSTTPPTTRYMLLGSMNGRLQEIDATGAILSDVSVLDSDADAAGSADPLDVAIDTHGNRWVTRYLQPTLIVLSPAGSAVATVDLGGYSDAPAVDGVKHPGMSAIAIVDGVAYVALRNLDDESLVAYPSKIVSIDVETFTPTSVLTLPANAEDPDNHFVLREDGPPTELWLGFTGGALDTPPTGGGLASIDVSTNPPTVHVAIDGTGAAGTQGIDGAGTPGFVGGFAIASAHVGWASVATLERDTNIDNPTSIVRFDPTTGAILATLASTPTSYLLWGVVHDAADGVLFVTDRTDSAPGLRVLSDDPARDGAPIAFLPTRLLPADLLILTP